MQIQTFAATDVGQTRKVNEDSFVLVPELGLVSVADGMGGFQRGDVASGLACNVLKETILGHRDLIDLFRRNPTEPNRASLRSLLEMAVQRACEEIYEASQTIAGEGGRMGTTMDAVLIVGTTAFLAHVGDSRVYLLRNGEAHQITEDHTLVQQQLREGIITPEEAKKARFKNVITRALGAFPSVLVDSLTFDVDRGDRLILCSDGLHRYIGHRELAFVIGNNTGDEAVSRLVDMANQRGGRDNITVVVANADTTASDEFVAPVRAHMEVLRKVDLFQFCTYRELMAVCQVAQQLAVEKGTVLFREGEIGRSCYIIQSGTVTIQKNNTQLALVRPADYFGEMSFFDQPRRSADAIALEDSQFLVIDRNNLMQLMKQDSELAAKLMWQLLQKMSRLVRTSNDRIVAETITLDDLEPMPNPADEPLVD